MDAEEVHLLLDEPRLPTASPPPQPVGWASRLVGVGLAGTALLGSLLAVGPLFEFVDLSSVLLVGGITGGTVLAVFGPRQALAAASLALGRGRPTAAELARGSAFWLTAAAVGLAGGLLGTILGGLALLMNMSDPASFGHGLAVQLLTSLYGVGVALAGVAAAVAVARRDPDPAVLEATAVHGVAGMALVGLPLIAADTGISVAAVAWMFA